MDAALGLAGMALFIAAVIALAAAVTWAVVKLLPAKPHNPTSPAP